MKAIYQPCVLLLLIISSCSRVDRENVTELSPPEPGDYFPVVMDTTHFSLTERKTHQPTEASYHLLYIGPPRDTLWVNPLLEFLPPPVTPQLEGIPLKEDSFKKNPLSVYFRDWLSGDHLKSVNQEKIEIRVDTLQRTYNRNASNENNEHFYYAYPVVLNNNSPDTLVIGYGHFLPLIMEAMDSTRQWRPIEHPFYYLCGNGIGSIILPPGEIALTSAIVYQGNSVTLLRLKLGHSYSPPFTGKINPEQFCEAFANGRYYPDE